MTPKDTAFFLPMIHGCWMKHGINTTKGTRGTSERGDAFMDFKQVGSKTVAREILRNAIKCNHCGEVIESKHAHDFKSCKCGCVHPGFSAKILKHDDSNRLISNNINYLRTDYQDTSSSCFYAFIMTRNAIIPPFEKASSCKFENPGFKRLLDMLGIGHE